MWITYIAVTETDARRFSNRESNVTVLEKFLMNERRVQMKDVNTIPL